MRKAKLGIVAAAAAGLITGGIMVAAPASADGKYAPSCVSRGTSKPILTVKNNCGRSMRLNLHIGGAPDTGCLNYTAGQKRSFAIPSIAWYQHVVLC